MTEWKKINSQQDIDELLNLYGGFHDSCLVSAVFHSGTYVDNDLAMHFDSAEKYILNATFQRQWRPKTLEMRFIGLRRFYLTGAQHNYGSDLFEAFISFHENILPGEPKRLIVWADDEFHADKIDNSLTEPAGSYIVANELEWKIIED